MVPIDLLDAGLWQALNLYKMQYLGSTVKQGMSIVLQQAIKIKIASKIEGLRKNIICDIFAALKANW